MGLTKDCNGKPSAMRVGFIVSLLVGSFMVIGGVIGMFLNLSDASIAMTSGTALISTGGFAKAIQARFEQGKPPSV